MEEVKKVQHRYSPVNWDIGTIRPMVLAGLGLVMVLGGLSALSPLLAIMSALMLLLLVVVMPRPVLVIYGLTLVLPLVGGLARGSVVPFLRLGQALVVLGLVLMVLSVPGRQGKTRLTAIDLVFMLYFLTDSVLPVLALLYRGEHLDLSNSSSFTGVTPLQSLLGPLQYYVLYRVVVAIVSSEKQIKTILNLSFIASILVSLIGIMQKLGVGFIVTFLNTYYPTVDLGYAVSDLELRITSTLDNYGGLAAYLAFTIIVALACYTVQKHLKFSRLLLTITILFDSIALILTGTFAPCIGLAIGAAIVFMLMRSLPKMVMYVLIGMALAVLAFYPFFSDRILSWIGGGGQELLPTYGYRILLWKEIFLPAILQHLWFGAGPSPAVSALWPSEETQYFALLLKGGGLDLLSYILLMGVAMATCWRQIKRGVESASNIVAVSTLAILVAINIMNVSAVYFTYVGGTQVLWMLLAVTVASGQVKALELSSTAKPIVNGKWRTIRAPIQSPLSTTASGALGKPTAEKRIPGERNSFGPCIVIPCTMGPGMVWLDQYRRRFTWLERVMDWHFVKDSVVVGAGFTISRMLGLLFMTLLAHFLTSDNFGYFRYALGLVSIITIASVAGPVSIARFLAANPDDSKARDCYFSNGLVGIALLLVLSLLVSVPVLWMLHAFDLGTIICIICFAAFYGYFFVVRGLGSAWKMSLTNVLSNVALIVALFIEIGFFKMRTATVVLAIYGLADLVPLLALELIKPISLRFRPGLISKTVVLELARFAMPLVIAAGTYTIWYEIDVLLIGNFYPHVAGSYAAAKTLSQAFIFIPSAITMVLMPKVANMELNKSKRYAVATILAAFLMCSVGLVIVYFWGHQVITLTFGERYSDAYLPLLVLSAGMSFYSVYILLESFIIGRGQPGLAVKALTVALVGTGAVGFWLTPHMGMLGASLAFTVGAILGAAVMLFSTWRLLMKEKSK
jgi:O-antigen/teichoic acid export membrane protein